MAAGPDAESHPASPVPDSHQQVPLKTPTLPPAPAAKRLALPKFLTAAIIAAGLTGCGSPPAANPVSRADPWESVNRPVFRFNEGFDRIVLQPVSNAYRAILPKPARTGVSNFFDNLDEPLTAANQILQGKPATGISDLGRFVVNSTVGLAGLTDPASELGLPEHDEDIGQTLAVWGVPSGPYVVLPLFGPNTVRDAPARITPRVARALYFDALGLENLKIPASAFGFVSDRADESRKLEAAREAALDPYLYIREAYLQRREFLIRDGRSPAATLEDSSTAPPAGETPADDFSVDLPDLDTEQPPDDFSVELPDDFTPQPTPSEPPPPDESAPGDFSVELPGEFQDE